MPLTYLIRPVRLTVHVCIESRLRRTPYVEGGLLVGVEEGVKVEELVEVAELAEVEKLAEVEELVEVKEHVRDRLIIQSYQC